MTFLKALEWVQRHGQAARKLDIASVVFSFAFAIYWHSWGWAIAGVVFSLCIFFNTKDKAVWLFLKKMAGDSKAVSPNRQARRACKADKRNFR